MTEWLEYFEVEGEMDQFLYRHEWKMPEAIFQTDQERALSKAPELYPALEVELEPWAKAQNVAWPLNRMQLRAFWRMVRLCEDEREFSWEWLQDVCSSNWFQTLERRPKKSGVY